MKKKKDQTKQPRVQKERTKMLCKEVGLICEFCSANQTLGFTHFQSQS